jgi:hypothetical protein
MATSSFVVIFVPVKHRPQINQLQFFLRFQSHIQAAGAGNQLCERAHQAVRAGKVEFSGNMTELGSRFNKAQPFFKKYLVRGGQAYFEKALRRRFNTHTDHHDNA